MRKAPAGKLFGGALALFSALLLLSLILFVFLEGKPSATNLIKPEQNYLVRYKLEQVRRALQSSRESHKMLLKQLEHAIDVSSNDLMTETNELCSSAYGFHVPIKSDVDTLEIFESLAGNQSVDSWKQPWNIKVEQKRFIQTKMKTNKLRVFLVPFSLNNPGGMNTLELNYARYTRHILEQMLKNLVDDQRLKFVWSEVSMFSIWWETLPSEKRQAVRKIISNGQLEFVSGGWVSAGQTSSHYYSLLTQLIEGRRWLHQYFGIEPQHALELHGLSPTLAYLLARVGTKGVIMHKVHYSLKNYFIEHKLLEFKWRQVWGDGRYRNDLFCHLMPFSSYDAVHTCGPNPAVCSNFDFKRMFLKKQVKTALPLAITAENVRQKSQLLLDMYRRKAMLFKTNVLLVPLGDDFAWGSQREWKTQVENYNALISYINSMPAFNARIQFASLNDYFSELNREISEEPLGTPAVLTGDIPPNVSVYKDYWPESFTWMPFLKEMDRDLVAHLRSAQIAFALMCGEISQRYSKEVVETSPYISRLLEHLVVTRRHLSLFQHHNALPGAVRSHVMNSYANKLFDGLKRSNHVLGKCLDILTHMNDPAFSIGYAFELPIRYSPTYERESQYALPRYNVLEFHSLNISEPAQLYAVFNPTLQRRAQLVAIYVPTSDVVAFDLKDKILQSEIFPIFESGKKDLTISQSVYQLYVLVHVEPLSVKNFRIKRVIGRKKVVRNMSRVFIKNVSVPKRTSDFLVLPLETDGSDTVLKISNEYVSILFDSSTGFAIGVEVRGNLYPCKIEFLTYNLNYSVGVHSFKPLIAKSIMNAAKPSTIVVVEGRLQSYVEVHVHPEVVHRVSLYSSGGIDTYSVEITNVVDIRHENAASEVIMRIKTGVHSGDTFYTDMNGFQVSQRKRFAKLPIHENYYPMSSYTFIEDADLRVTLLSKQPLGMASLASGELDVMLDRRVTNLGRNKDFISHHGIIENVQSRSTFKILFEKQTCRDKNKIKKPAMLSLASHVALQSLLHPLKTSSFIADRHWSTDGVTDYGARRYTQDFSCDIQLIDMLVLHNNYDQDAPMQNESFVGVGLLVHRVGFDGTFLDAFPVTECTSQRNHIGRFRLQQWTGIFKQKFQEMSLPFTTPKGKFLLSNSRVMLKPMEIYAFHLTFK